MKKFTKSLLTFGLVFALAACGSDPSSEPPSVSVEEPEEFTVTYWLTETAYYDEETIEESDEYWYEGPGVEAPERSGFEFLFWATKSVEGEEVVFTEYDFGRSRVTADLDLYAQWEAEFSADKLRYTLIGDLQNTDHKENGVWSTAYTALEMKETDPKDTKNEFSITVDLGYNGAIKVKSLYDPDGGLVDRWDDNYNYGDGHFVFDDEANYSNKSADGKGNVNIKNAGNYTITLTTTVVSGTTMGAEAVINIKRNGDPLEPDKVTANPDPNAAVVWRITGDVNGWNVTSEVDVFEADLVTQVHKYTVFLVEGGGFKLTIDGSWQNEVGYGKIVEDASAAGTLTSDNKYTQEQADAGEIPEGSVVGGPVIGGNNVVLETGFYSFEVAAVDPTVAKDDLEWTYNVSFTPIDELELAGGHNEWGAAVTEDDVLALSDGYPIITPAVTEGEGDDVVVVTPEIREYKFTGSVTTTEENVQFKARSIGGWTFDFGDPTSESGNYEAATAGTYTVEVTYTVEMVSGAPNITGTLTVTPPAA